MYLKNSKTIVIKIGSSLIINDKGILRKKWLSEISKTVLSVYKNETNKMSV